MNQIRICSGTFLARLAKDIGDEIVVNRAEEQVKLLMVDQRQFGYLTDTYFYCMYLRAAYEITYVCWDYGHEKIEMPGVSVMYVPRSGGRLKRWMAFVRSIREAVTSGRYDLAFLVYFRGCSVLWPVARTRRIILDVRTGSVRPNRLARKLENLLLRTETKGFRILSIISRSLLQSLGLDPESCTVVSVGGVRHEITQRNLEDFRLLYVGTLFGRELHKTIEGFDHVMSERGSSLRMTYDIIGDGPEKDKAKLLAAIERSPYRQAISYHGRIPHAHVRPFLEKANVGVAFIPLKDWYQCQPVTKVFEYLLAGLPVIATATYENTLVIRRDNGVLVEDSPEGFADGLRTIIARWAEYDARRIRESQLRNTWESIVRRDVEPLLRRVLVP